MQTDRAFSESSLGEACLVSHNQEFYLTMQGDGNLVVYKSRQFVSSNAVWASGTHGRGQRPFQLRMQGDGNAVIYDRNNNATWATGTHGKGKGPYSLVLSNDGALGVFDGNHTQLWSSK